MTTKIWPMPELLHGDVYEVKESPHKSVVCTDLVGKVMMVPSEDSDHGRMGRLHEMGHVAITPESSHEQASKRGIGYDYLNVAEDMRLSRYLADHFTLVMGMPEELFEHRIKGWVLEDDFKTIVLMAIASSYTPDCDFLIRNVANFKRDWYYDILAFVDRYKEWLNYDQSFDCALKIAEDLQNIFNNPMMKDGNISSLEREELMSLIASEGAVGEWGEMEIIEHPMPIQTGARRLIRKVKPEAAGAAMMFPHRLDIDDKIFGTIKKVPGGTILIDVSGSMSLATEDITNILKQAPGATVAIYSGERDYGKLQIIAKKGRMADMEHIDYDGGNVIDGPALHWLAQQNEPRIWLCDGHVTGVDDDAYANLTKEARETVAQNRITRAPYVNEVLKLLKTK